MKKIIILILVILVMFCSPIFAQEKPENQVVTKTYFLKHISPETVDRNLRTYYYRPASFDRNGNTITMRIEKKNIAAFEEMLKKLDVEKKKILLRVFTVIASNEGKSSEIENKDLKRVLSELQKILSFKAFRLDGVSALTVTDGQDDSRLRLSSQSVLLLDLRHIYIKQEKDGKHTVGFEFHLKQQEPVASKEGNPIYSTLIASETSVRENGYLVAGVSKIGKNGDSLVLIINAEIK